MFINFITPLSRPQNFNLIYKSILESVKDLNIDWQWVVVEDGDSLLGARKESDTVYISYPSDGEGISGNPQRNIALDHVKDGHIYFLDDDNIVHPEIFKVAKEYKIDETRNGMIVGQMWKSFVPRLIPHSNTIIPCHIDTAQFIIYSDMVKELRWENYNYCADGAFFSQLYKNYNNRFIITSQLLCYYNYLR